MPKVKGHIKKQLKNGLKKIKPKKYILRLYVAGLSPRSQKAIESIKKVCDKYLRSRYELTVQDIYQNPIIAKNSQILAAPTLIKMVPLPLRRFVGDMSNIDKLVVGLDLVSEEE
jgi:circadian clock protein KaiB